MTAAHIAQAPAEARRVDTGLLIWLAAIAFALLCLMLRQSVDWIAAYPANWVLPIPDVINAFTDWFDSIFQPFFRAISFALDKPMRAIQSVLQWLPWPAVMLLVGVTALRAGGWKLALFAVASLAYLVIVDYWTQSMNTLALVILAVPLSVVVGFALGVLADRVPKAIPVIEAALDTMQTMPAFAYLIPLLLLFGFGPVVGLIASAIYAIPPMVRNTLLGLQQVPPAIKESGQMSGCTRRQRFWHVEVPTAMPQILVGVNQTTMAVLSVVIIAAIIGGFSDIGWEVLSSMRKAQFGQSMLSGAVIALMAMVIDRITIGFARNKAAHRGSAAGWLRGWNFALSLLAALLIAVLLRFAIGTGTLLPGLEFVDDLEDALHLRNWFPSKTKFSERSADEIGGVLADCQSAKLPEIGRIRFCFDRVSGVVVHVSDPSGLRWDFADYPAGGKFLFPRTMRLNQAYQPRHLELKEINVTQIVFDAAAFAIPAGAREFEACGSKPTLHGGAPWDWISNPAKPEVYLYAVVEADGSLDDLRVYGHSKWAEHDVTKKARKKTFTPARCGGKPVAAEMLLRLAQKRPDVDLSRPASQNNCDPYCSQIVPRSPF